VRDDERAAAEYDASASAYAAHNLNSVDNAMFERPATIDLLGAVAGKRVLEIGCGAGPLTAWLIDQGAQVTGIDVSPGMLALARERVGTRAQLLLKSVEEPLDFAQDGSIDVVVASLVLHYVRDWLPPLREFRRVLAPGGVVVFSTHHPAMDWQVYSPDDYFAVKQVTETWTVGGGPFEVTFWRRPLTSMTEAIATAGFVIDRLVEPSPSPQIAARDPQAAHELATSPSFLFFRLLTVGPHPN
jgi:ubiquinone/menaquinone biosynthesis C-methylase UbiE